MAAEHGRDATRVPVLVGTGQLRGNRARTVEGATEPLTLIEQAARLAAEDTGSLLAALDSLDAVRTTSWAYADLPGLLADRLGVTPRRTHSTAIGGHWPAQLLDAAAARIAAGDSRVALIVGGEAQASLTALTRAGIDPVAAGWTAAPGGPPEFSPEDLGSPAMQASGILLPTRVYPLFESALRHRLGQSVTEANRWSAELYAAFTEAAAANPAAWEPTVRSAEDIATVGPGNRMVCEPYPLAENAMPMVDQAAALLLTSLAVAREHGIPEDRITYVWGGAGARDTPDVLQRNDFGGSQALERALGECLSRAGVSVAELGLVDVYSCFPVVPKLVSLTLGLPADAVPSVTGGHAAFGGPLSSYTLHSVVAVTQRLRRDGGPRLALVHGNGGYLTHQHALLLSRDAHPDGYVGDPEPVPAAGPAPTLVPVPGTATEVTVEAATVEYAREGSMSQAFLVARDADGNRLAGQSTPGDTVSAAAVSVADGREVVGRTVTVASRDGQLVIDGSGH